MEYIDKATFNKLGIKEQVKIFNSLLKSYNNIKEVCDIIGISYSTVRDRFQKNKYIFNKFSQQYELNSDNHKHKNNELEKIIEDVVKKLDRKSLEPISEVSRGDVTVRSFRVYANVLNDFIDFCDNSMMKQYDVLSLFIIDGIDKYTKK